MPMAESLLTAVCQELGVSFLSVNRWERGRTKPLPIVLKQIEVMVKEMGDRCWLYVVFKCASSHPQLLCIQGPFGKLIVKTQTSVVIDAQEMFQAAGN